MNPHRPSIQAADRAESPAPPALRAPAAPHAALARLQRTAGNQSTVAFVRGHLTAGHGLQRFGWADVKDAYHHLQSWRHRDEAKPEDVEDWSKNSDEVAFHSKQALAVAKSAYERLAREAKQRGDTRAAAEAEEAATQLEKASGYLETGEKVFKTSVKTITVIQQLDEMLEAARTLSSVDLGDVDKQQRAAEALDNLAGGFGQLGTELVPDVAGPVKGYFRFLAGFKAANFFAHWTEFIHDYTRRIDDAARSD